MQYLATGWLGELVTLSIVAFVLFNIWRAKGGKNLFVRRIAGLNAIDDAVGRAAEMGRPIIMVPGIGALNAISVQAINVFAQVAEKAVEFMTPIRVCTADPAVFTVAEEVIKDVYTRAGAVDRFDSLTVQFLTDRQFAFAAGVAGMILREKAAATFLLGEFYAESLIFAENANSVGAVQVAGSTQTTQTPFFIAACDYVLLGDEYYAASAYLTRQPVLVGSLVGQDWAKIGIAAAVVLGFLMNSFERREMTAVHRNDDDDTGTSSWDPVKKGPELKKMADLGMTVLFRPFIEKKQLAIYRETDPEWIQHHPGDASSRLPKGPDAKPLHDDAWVSANVTEAKQLIDAENKKQVDDMLKPAEAPK